jgi:hypothetical protein
MGNEFRELFRYQRGDEVRIYNLRVVPGVELWRMTEVAGREPTSAKEANLASTEEAIELLHDIQRSLTAAGWTQMSSMMTNRR